MQGIQLILEIGTWQGYALFVVIVLVCSTAGYVSWLLLDKKFKIDKRLSWLKLDKMFKIDKRLKKAIDKLKARVKKSP